jgi:hypothetical protein
MAVAVAPPRVAHEAVIVFHDPFKAWDYVSDLAFKRHQGQRVRQLNSRVGMCRSQTIQKTETLAEELGVKIEARYS